MEKENKMLKTSKINKKEKQNPTVTKLKKASGITLVALVITIVVLIILATVSITLTLREGSIFSGAETAKQMQEMAGIKEEADLVKNELITKSYTEGGAKINKDNLLQALQDHFEGSTIEGNNKVIVHNGKYEIIVDDNLNISVQKREDSSDGGEDPENPDDQLATIGITYTIDNLDENTKVINLSYTGVGTELSAPKIETVIQAMLGVSVADYRENLQQDAITNGITYEVRLLEFMIEKASNPQIESLAPMRAGMQAEATSFGITYEEYLVEKIFAAFGTTVDSDLRTRWKQEAANNGMTYLAYLGNIAKIDENADILKDTENIVTIGDTTVREQGSLLTQIYAKRSGTYKIVVETEEAKGEKEIPVEGITNEKFSEIYTASAVYTDNLGNKAKIPAGFAVGTSEDISYIDTGLVITDSVDANGYSNGNEYVWIPVSNIDGDNEVTGTETEEELIKVRQADGSIKKVEITLGRYTFNTTNGTPTIVQKGEAYASETPLNTSYKELKDFRQSVDNDGPDGLNETAKDLKGFIESVEENGGYYIARYEASYESGSSVSDYKLASKVSTLAAETIKNVFLPKGKLWSCITQGNMAKVCKNMYTESNSVESDLVNSFAWDTAIVYIQNCSKNSNYANANSETTGNYGVLKNTGLTGDVVCNVYDMAANLYEWTTEYCTNAYSTDAFPCVHRGGFCHNTDLYTASRYSCKATNSNDTVSGRSLLYNSKTET